MILMPRYAPSCNKVRIAGHNHIGPGGDGAFEDSVVVRIGLYDINRLGGGDAFGERFDLRAHTVQAII
jgi:hypothetical protein